MVTVDAHEEGSRRADDSSLSASAAADDGKTAVKVDLGDCRFYEERFPAVDDLIMVKVNRIADLGAYVSLLEYNNVEGMILLSELSKRRFRSVNKLIRVGRHEVVMVLRVDPKKGYIDLSKRRVSPEDIVKCEERFSKSKKVHQTVRHVAQRHGLKVEELNRRVIWPLYKKYGHALDALKDAAMRPDEVFGGLDVDADVRASLVQDIQLRLAPQALKLRAHIDVWCFGKDGIDAVKAALCAGKAVGTEDVSISIKLIAPPQYVVVTSCFEKEVGMVKIEEALKAIETKIKSFKGGDFKKQSEIIVMGGEDTRRLEELLQEQEETSDEEEAEEDQYLPGPADEEFEDQADEKKEASPAT